MPAATAHFYAWPSVHLPMLTCLPPSTPLPVLTSCQPTRITADSFLSAVRYGVGAHSPEQVKPAGGCGPVAVGAMQAAGWAAAALP